MAVDWFRPHWTHEQCGGIVAGLGNEFQCEKCGAAGRAIRATIPADTVDHREYFNCHPELAVTFCDVATEAQPNMQDSSLRPAGARSRWIDRLMGRASARLQLTPGSVEREFLLPK